MKKLIVSICAFMALSSVFASDSWLRLAPMFSLNGGGSPAFYAGFGSRITALPNDSALGFDLAVLSAPAYNDTVNNNPGSSWATSYMAGLSLYNSNPTDKVKLSFGIGAQYQAQQFTCRTSNSGCNNDNNNTVAPYMQVMIGYALSNRFTAGLLTVQSTNKTNGALNSYAGLSLSYSLQ